MPRSLAKWLAGPMMFIVVARTTIAARLSGISFTFTAVIVPTLAFAVAWMGLQPVLKPKTACCSRASVERTVEE